jgi:hypothetical protein
LLLRNNAADRSRNGVVGSTGRKIPIIPNPRAKSPNIVCIILIIGAKDKLKIDYFCVEYTFR